MESAGVRSGIASTISDAPADPSRVADPRARSHRNRLLEVVRSEFHFRFRQVADLAHEARLRRRSRKTCDRPYVEAPSSEEVLEALGPNLGEERAARYRRAYEASGDRVEGAEP